MAKIDPGHIESMRPKHVPSEHPRRLRWRPWMTWYGAVILLLGGLGAWLDERLLGLAASLGFGLFGLAAVSLAVNGVRTGVMERGSVRDRNPIAFWLEVAAFTALGTFFTRVGIRMLVSVLLGAAGR